MGTMRFGAVLERIFFRISVSANAADWAFLDRAVALSPTAADVSIGLARVLKMLGRNK